MIVIEYFKMMVDVINVIKNIVPNVIFMMRHQIEFAINAFMIIILVMEIV